MTPNWVRLIDWDGKRKELSLRHQCRGGGIRTLARETPVGMLSRARRVVFLIHGFNVDSCQAAASYEQFVESMLFRWAARTLWVYWPGDATAPWDRNSRTSSKLSRLISVGSYPLQPERAEESARLMANYIGAATARRSTPIRISIVAHSLGCRLALELLRLLGPSVSGESIKLELLVLMAAAVPKYELKARKRYDLSTHKDLDTTVYFSRKDEVLLGAFRPGQFWASTNPISRLIGRGPLGREGLGLAAPPNVNQIEVRHRHSDYWRDRKIAWHVIDKLDGKQRPLYKRLVVPRQYDRPRIVRGRSLKKRAGGHTKSLSDMRDKCNC